jgi:glycosyltransferase involved in cell wall biosynthesis
MAFSLPRPHEHERTFLASGQFLSRQRLWGQVSGLVPFKGHRLLLKAAKKVLQNRSDVYFICAGFPRAGQEYVTLLHEDAQRLGIHDRIRIISYAGNIADIWNVIDIHVHASMLDSLPNAISEGMSLSKPAVATRVGGVPDIVEDEISGLLVPPGEPQLLADAILRLPRDAAYSRNLGRAAYQKYLALFTPDITCRQIEQCWTQCVPIFIEARAHVSGHDQEAEVSARLR